MWVPIYHAVRDFWRERCRWGGAEIPIVFAGPDRAHQEIRRIMAEREQRETGVATTPQANEDRSVPVPFISLYITPPKYDAPRFNPHRYVLDKDIKAGTAKVARHMHPIQSQVQVDLWCGSAGGDLIAMSVEPQIEIAFYGGKRSLPLNWADRRWFKPPFNVSEHVKWLGQSAVVLYTEGWEDTSDLETGDGPKEVRRTWRGRLDGYVPFSLEEARIVRSVEFGVSVGLTEDTAVAAGNIAVGLED